MHITNDIRYVGVNDHEIDLFEGIYDVPNGMSYNSYVVIDEKIAVMDSVDRGFGDLWLKNIETALSGRTPDYLVVQHMEPDHSSNIALFMKTYPQAVVVASAKSFAMMKQFFADEYASRRRIVKEGDVLSLGRHELAFIAAPMVHWPEVIMTYDKADKVFFSADAFGKFGALDVEDEWACEARRYYFGIVGKYGAQVQALLKKAAALEIEKICSLHGPVLADHIDEYIRLYDIWSSYGVESEGVVIAYTSIYGNTKIAAQMLRDKLIQMGCPKVAMTDLAREDMAEAVEDAFRHGKLVLAAPTYNGDVFPFMRTFIHSLVERGYRNRKIGLIENGSWAPMAAKVMRGMLEGCKELTFAEPVVRILSAVSEENMAQIDTLAQEMLR
ncbi:MAG: FprA family A-type flavoprotein [Clostridia bacterium]|nr:FprA family A-type flavoprotein [Clostridia bacterium]